MRILLLLAALSPPCLGFVPSSSSWNVHHHPTASFYHRDREDLLLLSSMGRSERYCRINFRALSSRLLMSDTDTATASPTIKTKVKLDHHSKRWEDQYNALVEYQKQNGHSNVPSRQGALGRWVDSQRKRYKNTLCSDDDRQEKPHLTQDQINKLETIGFEWDMLAAQWEKNYSALATFQQENGHCKVPYCNTGLGKWVSHQRECYRYDDILRNEGGRGRSSPSADSMALSQDRIAKFEAIGFTWDVLAEQWDENYKSLVEYHKANGHCNVPATRCDTLSWWVQYQRKDYKSYVEAGETRNRSKAVSAEVMEQRIERLEELGFQWKFIEDWETRYEELLRYKTKYGHCNVNTASGGPLGNWVKRQREVYKKIRNVDRGEGERTSSVLSDERIKCLEDIGFQWRLKEIPEWDMRYQELIAYKEKHGDCLVPQRSGKLGEWVFTQRKLYKNLRDYRPGPVIVQERIDRLNEIEFVWEINPLPDWDAMYSTLQAYHEKNGHCHLATSRKRLFQWSNQQRYQYARYRQDLPSLMDKKQVLKLNRLGFEWDPEEAEWKAICEEVKVYIEDHGLDSLDDSDDKLRVQAPESSKLYAWVMKQRESYKENELSSGQVTSLDAIGFSWATGSSPR